MNQNRFRFRVWAYNKMQTPSEKWGGDVFIRLNGTPYLQMDVAENTGLDVMNNKDLAIMQSTGIKDKNGKLIYEGDRLKEFRRDKNLEFTYELLWGNKTAEWLLKTKAGSSRKLERCLSKGGWSTLEVIGNIYEDSVLPPNPTKES